jgi:uncharacterized membrane protein
MSAVFWRRIDALQREVSQLRSALQAGPLASHPGQASDLDPVVVEPETAHAGDSPAVSSVKHPGRRLSLPRFDLEDLFGRLLPIWAGGITLAVAGFFLVRWSIDAGLLTPAVRVALAGLFGIALLAGAEAAYRWRERVADPRVAQALAGAGVATLYAAFYLAGTAYGLIGSTLAFLGLAAVTGAAIALSFRFGLPSAVLGLVGGFAAPALVGSDQSNLPLLTLYLALVTGGLALTGRRQDRAWLGMAALGGGLGWGALLLAADAARTSDGLVLGAYLVLLGGVLPALSGGSGRPHLLLRIGAAAIGALQLAALIQLGGFGAMQWGFYLLLGAALAWFGWREPAMREATAVGAAVGVALLPVWPDPSGTAFTAVCFGLAAIFAAVPLAQVWRGQGRALDLAQVSGVALGLAIGAIGQFGSPLPGSPDPLLAIALLVLAGLPAAAAIRSDGSLEGRRNAWLMVADASAALIGMGALAQVLPQNTLAWIAAAGVVLLAWRAPRSIGALGMLVVLAAVWAVPILGRWAQAGVLAVIGNPLTSSDLPTLRDLALHLLPAIAAGGAWWNSAPAPSGLRRALGIATVAAAAIAGHVAFRHAFAALAGVDFVATGVIQRAGWEAVLIALACLASARGWRAAAIGLAGAALAHFAWFSLVLHNPLWSEQAIGALPLANALLPAYAAGLAALIGLRRWLPALPLLRGGIDALIMATAALLSISELRQAFSGGLLTATPVGPAEDLLRSLLGIVLAIGFMLWGAKSGERSWRVGSLTLMVMAVLKVFLVDAAGLAGLARIASFMALGFSLIGIGGFYTRQLRPTTLAGAP